MPALFALCFTTEISCRLCHEDMKMQYSNAPSRVFVRKWVAEN